MSQLEDFAIVVFSCDKNDDVWPVFYRCLNKYWPDHPKTYLLNETKKYSNFDYDLDHWTKRIRESLEMIPYSKILFICDDCFLNAPVNVDKLQDGLKLLDRKNAACVNLEILYDYTDIETGIKGFKKKTTGKRNFLLNLLCGLWNKDVLIDILSYKDCNPWLVEKEQNHKGYDYYQTVYDKVLSWFRDTPGLGASIRFGKWSHDVECFAKQENIIIDFSKKGFQ